MTPDEMARRSTLLASLEGRCRELGWQDDGTLSSLPAFIQSVADERDAERIISQREESRTKVEGDTVYYQKVQLDLAREKLTLVTKRLDETRHLLDEKDEVMRRAIEAKDAGIAMLKEDLDKAREEIRLLRRSRIQKLFDLLRSRCAL